ncbi:hypothetical protein LCGC14_2657790 [marine sediment metagenome]|uniref:Response regulatory domain-containing protein n=1 Tax=marine sediment metagenome TaxID=412755 RepID=A0A0F9C3A3_9ZZZZ
MLCTSRILIADDEPMFLETTAELLGYRGYECDCARDASEAAELLGRQRYDLLISDIKMPGNSNLEFINSLKKIAKGMPVILVTAYPSIESAIESIHLPVVAYLRKPVEFDELLSKVEEGLRQSEAGRKAHQAREHLASWRQTLQEADTLLQQTDEQSAAASLDAFVALNLKSVADVLSNFSRLTEDMTDDRSAQEEWALIASAQLDMAHDALIEAIGVLEQTKDSFKSKQLGRLRRKLQLLVDTWPKRTGQLVT